MNCIVTWGSIHALALRLIFCRFRRKSTTIHTLSLRHRFFFLLAWSLAAGESFSASRNVNHSLYLMLIQ